ncbi:MAG: type II toxin-antitoxin system RelE/ParE family toxin [Proteobacteria bacterium]|nr:type II toxin-antitoxin system RelE/ParE family toxin [Pseudomonadota bacterium]MBU4010794.1 type II toxin-antitoxin system RelE/ParE family toxin [Pseudomonadota bacterium]
MQIVWTQEALEKLAEMQEYISKDNLKRAITFTKFLIEQGETLIDHPEMGRVVPEIGNESIRELIVKKYRIIYRLSGKRVEILTVFEVHRLLRFEDIDNL